MTTSKLMSQNVPGLLAVSLLPSHTIKAQGLMRTLAKYRRRDEFLLMPF